MVPNPQNALLAARNAKLVGSTRCFGPLLKDFQAVWTANCSSAFNLMSDLYEEDTVGGNLPRITTACGIIRGK
jgi:hypothetical protein